MPNPYLIQERISYQQTVLDGLPSTREAIMLRVEAMDILANHYWFVRDHERAGELLKAGMELVAPLHMDIQESKFLNGLAVNFFDQEQYAEAHQTLERSIELNPKDESLLVNLGIVEYALGRSAQSIRIIGKAIRSDNGSAGLYYILGYVHFLAGKIETAISCFEKTIQLDREHFPAQCAAAVCYVMMGAQGNAEKVMKELDTKEVALSPEQSICLTAFKGDQFSALEKLRVAVSERRISPHFVRRDPSIHLLFDGTTLNSII